VRGGEVSTQQLVVEPVPGQVAGDPAAKASRLHQPGLELELADVILGGRLAPPVVRGVAGVAEGLRRALHQGQLDRQRRVRGDFASRGGVGGMRVGEQRVERLLPGQRGPAGRDPGRRGRGQQRLVGRGEHEGGHVDAVGALSAAAVALAKAQREPRGRAERGGHRPDLPAPDPVGTFADGAGEEPLRRLPGHLHDRAALDGDGADRATFRADRRAEGCEINVPERHPLHPIEPSR